jgi:hypothetical protein
MTVRLSDNPFTSEKLTSTDLNDTLQYLTVSKLVKLTYGSYVTTGTGEGIKTAYCPNAITITGSSPVITNIYLKTDVTGSFKNSVVYGLMLKLTGSSLGTKYISRKYSTSGLYSSAMTSYTYDRSSSITSVTKPKELLDSSENPLTTFFVSTSNNTVSSDSITDGVVIPIILTDTSTTLTFGVYAGSGTTSEHTTVANTELYVTYLDSIHITEM